MVLLLIFALRLVFLQLRDDAPSEYLIGGYRGVAILVGLAVLLFLFPKIVRWFVVALFLMLVLISIGLAIRTHSVGVMINGVVCFGAALWLFGTRFPAQPPPLPKADER